MYFDNARKWGDVFDFEATFVNNFLEPEYTYIYKWGRKLTRWDYAQNEKDQFLKWEHEQKINELRDKFNQSIINKMYGINRE